MCLSWKFAQLIFSEKAQDRWKITEEINGSSTFFVPRSIYEQKTHWSVEFWSSEDSFITFLEEGLA